MCVYPAPSDAFSKKVGVAVNVSFDAEAATRPMLALRSLGSGSVGTENVKPFLIPTVGDPLGAWLLNVPDM